MLLLRSPVRTSRVVAQARGDDGASEAPKSARRRGFLTGNPLVVELYGRKAHMFLRACMCCCSGCVRAP
jgi:hypothetical protein